MCGQEGGEKNGCSVGEGSGKCNKQGVRKDGEEGEWDEREGVVVRVSRLDLDNFIETSMGVNTGSPIVFQSDVVAYTDLITFLIMNERDNFPRGCQCNASVINIDTISQQYIADTIIIHFQSHL